MLWKFYIQLKLKSIKVVSRIWLKCKDSEVISVVIEIKQVLIGRLF